MGLARRRHFATRGRRCSASRTSCSASRPGSSAASWPIVDDGREISGHGALIAALETARTGRLTDIVATIQGEQDEIIRSELPGVLVVQGGPGTGKTVVALHRAAYLLYTHRFPLEGQGVLVVGPNRLFLGYIEQVLPSLGEAGVELAVLADLIADAAAIRGDDAPADRPGQGRPPHGQGAGQGGARPASARCATTCAVGYGVADPAPHAPSRPQRIVADARRRFRTHNAGRRFVEQQLFEALAASAPRARSSAGEVRDRLRRTPRCARRSSGCGRCSPRPSCSTTCSARSRCCGSAGGGVARPTSEVDALHRPAVGARRRGRVDRRRRAAARRGPRPARPEAAARRAAPADDDEVRTYGHIVVDEAQDLSPMQLRMLTRRSLNGSMTVVGDIAQATGAWAHADWDEVLEPPARPPARRAGPSSPSATASRRRTWRWPPGCSRVAAPDLHAAARRCARTATRPAFVRAPAPDGARRRRGRRRVVERARRGRRRQRRGDLPDVAGRRASAPPSSAAGVELRPRRPQRPRPARSRWCRSAW